MEHLSYEVFRHTLFSICVLILQMFHTSWGLPYFVLQNRVRAVHPTCELERIFPDFELSGHPLTLTFTLMGNEKSSVIFHGCLWYVAGSRRYPNLGGTCNPHQEETWLRFKPGDLWLGARCTNHVCHCSGSDDIFNKKYWK